MYYEMKQILVTNGKVCRTHKNAERIPVNKTIFRSLSAFAAFKNTETNKSSLFSIIFNSKNLRNKI
jgi:hypothetical protein